MVAIQRECSSSESTSADWSRSRGRGSALSEALARRTCSLGRRRRSLGRRRCSLGSCAEALADCRRQEQAR